MYILIDSGAEENYVSPKFPHAKRIEVESKKQAATLHGKSLIKYKKKVNIIGFSI